MSRNLSTTLRRRRARDPMRAFDRAPEPLRRWLAGAALSWSVDSALKVYAGALRRTRGDAAAALAILDVRERDLLARDAARIWGPTHPAATAEGLMGAPHKAALRPGAAGWGWARSRASSPPMKKRRPRASIGVETPC